MPAGLHTNSREAHQDITRTGKKTSLEMRVYAYIREHPGCTDEDIAIGLLGPHARRQDVAPRSTTLHDKGLIEASGNTKRNGRTVRTWKTVDHRPKQQSIFTSITI